MTRTAACCLALLAFAATSATAHDPVPHTVTQHVESHPDCAVCGAWVADNSRVFAPLRQRLEDIRVRVVEEHRAAARQQQAAARRQAEDAREVEAARQQVMRIKSRTEKAQREVQLARRQVEQAQRKIEERLKTAQRKVDQRLKEGERRMAEQLKQAAQQRKPHSNWPRSQKGLVFHWPSDSRGFFETNGRVAVGPEMQFDLSQGAVLFDDVSEELLKACKKSNEVTLAIDFTTESVKQRGPARILSFSESSSSRNFTMGQEGDNLVLRLRTTKNDANGTRPQVDMLELEKGERQRVVICYRPGRLVVHANGKRVLHTNLLQGGLSNWSPQHLILGDEWDGQRNWKGIVHRLAIYSRSLPNDEAKKLFR